MSKEQAFQSDLADIEWAQVALDKVVVANKDRAWLRRPSFAKNRFAEPMTGDGNIATSRKLLDGAIAAAKKVTNYDAEALCYTHYSRVWQLASTYHLHQATSTLMEEACVGFSMIGRWGLAGWAAQKSNEEEGLERLVFQEIEFIGFDPHAVVKLLVPPIADALADYFTRTVRDWNPIDCIGYSYAIERLAIGLKKKYIEKMKTSLSLMANEIYRIELHTSITHDLKRVEDTVKMIAELTAKDRIRIVTACYETALIYLSPSIEGSISDEKLKQILEPLRINR